MITVIGMGPAHTAPAHTPTPLPERTALLVGARRHLDAVRPHLPANANAAPDTHTDTDTTELVLGPLAPALDTIADHVDRGLPVTVLASGDPGFFGIVRALADRFGPGLLDVRPGVSSVAAAFSRLGLPWDDAVVVSAHGRDPRTAVNLCRAHPKVAVLTGPGAGPAELGAALADTGRTLVVASALGDPERERVEPVTPAEAAARDWGTAVSLVLCLDERRALGGARTVAGIPARPAGWALPEEAFAFRDSMITKFEVRALALARLAPGPGDLVWDVGAGSGSVAVECARLGAAAVAVEKDLDGAERIRGNAASHGVDVRVVRGAAPGALAGLADDPDAVFVGGGGRELPEIVAVCARRARRAVVVALAALDRVPAARAALTDAGLVCDGVLLQSSRLAPLPGEVTRLAATNPVFLLWGLRTPVSSEGVVQ